MIQLDRLIAVRLFVGLLSVVFISACDVETPTDSGPVDPTSEIDPAVHAEAMKEAPDEARVYGPLDAYYLSLAKEHPGFGGLYFKDGEMVIQTKSGQVPEGLQGIGHPAVVKRGSAVAFSFEELARWYGPFVDAVATTEWYQTDIDERANRLYATVADVKAAREVLQEAGVPSIVYTLRKGNPLQPASKTLRDKFRPVPSGVQIKVLSMTQLSTCTAGFNLSHWEFGPAMVTASHCTALTAELDVGDAEVHQPVLGNRVGAEVFDLEAFTHPDCPEDYCRYSDAAVISYVDSISYQLGKVAKPTTNSGSINVAGLRFTIVDEDITGPADGTPLYHIGRTTGWNNGEVEATCANINWYSHQNYGLLCQYESGFAVEGGDSGGPVLIPSPSSDSVTLAGIQHSVEQDLTLDKDTWFSPIGGIRWEIQPNSELSCDGLLTTHDGGCGDSGGSGSWDGGGGDDCGQFAIQEC